MKKEQHGPATDKRCAYDDARDSIRRAPNAASPVTQEFAEKRVLVVEDNPVNQQVAVKMLEKFGCRVDAAVNGLEAVAMYRTQRYDLILMDCQMPEMDGYMATQQIRAMEKDSPHTPIIALTAYASPSEQEKCLKSGMNDLISKPVRLPMLENTLRRWLQHASETQPTVIAPDDELEAVKGVFGPDFAELAEFYLTHSLERIAALREAARADDILAVAKTAHAFAGSSASIGASNLCKLCKDLEIAAKTGAVPDCDARLMAIESEYARIRSKLQHLIRVS